MSASNGLSKALDQSSKDWWSLSIGFKLAGFSVGLCTLTTLSAEVVASLTTACAFFADLAGWRSDHVKAIAQALRRKLDLADSFGWDVSKEEYSDLFARSSAFVRARADTVSEEPYFDSNEPPGPKRGLENISESAWWTKHLADRMRNICIIALFSGLTSAIIALLVAVRTPIKDDLRAPVARIVTAFVMLLLSIGVGKLALSYHKLAGKAETCERTAIGLLAGGGYDQLDAFRVYYDYHLARASGPLLPTWLWRDRRVTLEAAWKTRGKTKLG